MGNQQRQKFKSSVDKKAEAVTAVVDQRSRRDTILRALSDWSNVVWLRLRCPKLNPTYARTCMIDALFWSG